MSLLKTNFTLLEETLQKLGTEKETGDLYYLFTEFHRHGQEFIDFFTDDKIEELYTEK